jgi:GTP diphosphokinase / guanosine-3',5'-bis(diphosphate) 3'-diphosphatase
MKYSELFTKTLEELEEYYHLLLNNLPNKYLLKAAYSYAKASHGEQLRDQENTLYIVHPLRIAIRLIDELKIDNTEIIVSALFHDLLEDTDADIDYIKNTFGELVITNIKALTRNRPTNENDNDKFLSKLKKLEELKNESYEIRLIKVLDIIDNMNSWKKIEPNTKLAQKLTRWLKELELGYLPLAETVSTNFVNDMQEIKKIILEKNHININNIV